MNLAMDFRYALRALRRTPSVTAIIVLTLALCIGANTAIFSVVDATLLRPLPYPEPNRLAHIARHFQGRNGEGDSIGQNGRVWEAIRDHATFLDAAVLAGHEGVNFAAAGNVQYVEQQRVSAGFFRVLGIEPVLGREFTRAEDLPGGPPIAILSFHLWKRIFNTDPSIVGRTIMLRGEPYTVIGVMPENFQSSVPADLWTPLRPTSTGEGSGINYEIIARIRPGATWAQADTQIGAIGAPILRQMYSKNNNVKLRLVSLQQGQMEGLKKPLVILWAAVGLVLLIGCANITSLLLARAATRTREMATRIAIGGGRAAIVRQLLVEAVVLAVFGGAAGLLVGYAGMVWLKDLAANQFPTVATVQLDARVLAATAALALLASLLAGIFPALEASVVDIRTALSEAGGRGVAGRRKRWSRRVLVSGEVALAVLLLIGAGLMIRMLATLYNLHAGFDPNNVIAASFSLRDARYATSERVNQLLEAGLERIRELPGVESAAAGLTLPYQRNLNDGFRHLDGPQVGDDYVITDLCYVTPGYFETLRMPLMRGRVFRTSDGAHSAGVAVVNEAFARKYLSRQDPLGSHIEVESAAREIVGIVGNVQNSPGWGDYGPLGAIPIVYIPAAQTSDGFLKLVHVWISPNWVVRASGPPADTIRGIQDAAAKIDPLLPIAAFHTMRDLRNESIHWQRFQATLLTALAGLALVLAIVGIHGLMVQSVVERRRELGIRIALGSSIAQAVRDAALPGIQLALAGLIAGCLLAVASSKILAHLVWGVSATDPATYAGVVLVLLLVAATASLVPALRIVRLNPADTLREE